jgi:hypothetical protein
MHCYLVRGCWQVHCYLVGVVLADALKPCVEALADAP